MGPGSAGHQLLISWLEQGPRDGLLSAWEAHTKTLLGQLDAVQAQRTRDEILALARVVAEAAGGFLGLGSVSKAEGDLLRRIEDAQAA
jgi:hypothetical protein